MNQIAQQYYQNNLHRFLGSSGGNIIVIVVDPPYRVGIGGRFNSAEEVVKVFPEVGPNLTSTEHCLVKRLSDETNQPRYLKTPGRGS